MSQPAQPRTGRAVGVGAGLVFASAAILGLLGKWEPSRQDPGLVYADMLATPPGLPTVCDGITKHVATVPVIVGERWSPAKCEQQKRQAVVYVQTRLLQCFTRNPPQSVFDAATSHAWNFGVNRTCGSQAMRAWNEGAWALGCRRIAFSDSGKRVWSSAGGKFVRGLAYRREDEMRLCMRGVR